MPARSVRQLRVVVSSGCSVLVELAVVCGEVVLVVVGVVVDIGSGLVVRGSEGLGEEDAGPSTVEDVASPGVVVGLVGTGVLELLAGPGGPAGPLSPFGGWFRAKATTTATIAVPVPVAATA
ncbi:hypothetical protein AB0K14_22345 [Actinosynnema sp. NPDC050801]|uniref:hypothetical protein n=1 Tax=unclassified Actinosynnema TaxID=2637065 RepID=UPI003404BE54